MYFELFGDVYIGRVVYIGVGMSVVECNYGVDVDFYGR